MPAKSVKQQRFMGMVHAAQKGEGAASPEVSKVAGSMAPSDVTDFASTPQKGLPTRVRKPAPKNVAPRPSGPPQGAGGGIPVKNVGGPPVSKMPMPMAKGGSVKKGGC